MDWNAFPSSLSEEKSQFEVIASRLTSVLEQIQVLATTPEGKLTAQCIAFSEATLQRLHEGFVQQKVEPARLALEVAGLPPRYLGGRQSDDLPYEEDVVRRKLDELVGPAKDAARRVLDTRTVAEFLRDHAGDHEVIALWMKVSRELPRPLFIWLMLAHPGSVRVAVGVHQLTLIAPELAPILFHSQDVAPGVVVNDRFGMTHPLEPRPFAVEPPFAMVRTRHAIGTSEGQAVIIDCARRRFSFPESSLQSFWQEWQRFDAFENAGVRFSTVAGPTFLVPYEKLYWEPLYPLTDA